MNSFYAINHQLITFHQIYLLTTKFDVDNSYRATKTRKISSEYYFLNSIKTTDKKRPRRSVVYKMVAMTRLELVTPAL